MLPRLTALRSLDLTSGSWMEFGGDIDVLMETGQPSAWDAFFRSLPETQLRILTLRGISWLADAGGWLALAAALPRCDLLEVLDVSWTGDAGAAAGARLRRRCRKRRG